MPISPRHQARTLAVQSLYEWDLTGHDPFVALAGHVRQQKVSANVEIFAKELISLVQLHQKEIDERLANVASQRPLSQMARVEKAILRLAICEILFNNAVPGRAAINEAIELAKTYGGENSSRFINGVLGTIFTQYEVSQPLPLFNTESEAQTIMSTSPHWETLKQVIVEQLDVEESEVKPEASFIDDLNADSLDLVELIMALEEKFNVKISDDDARKIRTVGNALEFIDEHDQ